MVDGDRGRKRAAFHVPKILSENSVYPSRPSIGIGSFRMAEVPKISEFRRMSEVVKDANLGGKQNSMAQEPVQLADLMDLRRASLWNAQGRAPTAVAACLILVAQVAAVLVCDTSGSGCQGGWPALSVSTLVSATGQRTL